MKTKNTIKITLTLALIIAMGITQLAIAQGPNNLIDQANLQNPLTAATVVADYNFDGVWYSKDTDGTDLGKVEITGNTAKYSKFPTTNVTIVRHYNAPFSPVIYVTNVTNRVAQRFTAVYSDQEGGIIRFMNGGTWKRNK